MLTDVHKRNIIELPAEITPVAVESYRHSTARILADDPELLLLDCSRVSYVSSTHVGLIWETHLDCERRAVELRLTNVSDQIRVVLRILDLDDVFLPTDVDHRPAFTPPQAPAGVHSWESFEDTVKLTKTGIEEGVGRFVVYLQSLGLGSVAVFEFRLIYYEIVMNVKFHSRLTEKDSVALEAHAGNTGITLTFRDFGAPFDPTTLPKELDAQEAARQGKVRGFGLTMIRKLVDVMTYTYEESSTNKLTIFKKWGQTI